MEAIDTARDTTDVSLIGRSGGGWKTVLRDVLVFQFKLVVDGLKDLCLAQLAVGAALWDLFRRDGNPGRRFYAVVRLSDRFDRWLDLHEAMDRAPEDAPDYVPTTGRSVDDLIDGLETGARVVAERSMTVSARSVGAVRQKVEPNRRTTRGGRTTGVGPGREAFDRA